MLLLALAVWALRPSVPTVDDYRGDLAQLAETTEARGEDPMAIAAQALLDATAEEPIRADLVRKAATWFDYATPGDSTGQAPFFAGLSWRLAGREEVARDAFGKVSEDSRYARAARSALQ